MKKANVEVITKPNEPTLALIRRFSRRVSSAGVIQKVKSLRFREKEQSKNVKHGQKVKYLKKRAATLRMVKLGQLPEKRGYESK